MNDTVNNNFCPAGMYDGSQLTHAVSRPPLDYYHQEQQMDHNEMQMIPDEHLFYQEYLRNDTRQGNDDVANFDFNNAYPRSSTDHSMPMAMGPQNSGCFYGGLQLPPPPGFVHPPVPPQLEFFQPPPMDIPFNFSPSWMTFPQQMVSGIPPPFPPLGGQQTELLPFKLPFPPSALISRPWEKFEAPITDSVYSIKGMPLSHIQNRKTPSDDPWWRSRTTSQENWDFREPGFSGFDSGFGSRLGNLGGGYADNACDNIQSEERFHQQLSKFSKLPIDVHRKIQNMPGCVITDYFEVTVVRFRNENIIESNQCHVVYTKKPETGQCWLMAFSMRDRFRTSIKFNRLLTSHLKVKLNGKTAVEIQPSKAAPCNDGEFYMFNFALEAETNKFIEVLDRARSQIWNHEAGHPSAHFSKSQDMVPHVYRFNSNDFKVVASSSSNESLPGRRPYRSLPKPGRDNLNILDSPNFRGSLQETLWPQYGGLKGEENTLLERPEPGVQSDLKYVKFNENMSVFVMCANGYTILGTGDLSVVSHENYFEEVIFVGKKKEMIFNHYFYKWNNLERGESDSVHFCKWNAAVCFNGSPNEIPVYRDFKVQDTSEDIISNFYNAMSQARTKGSDLTVSLKY